MIITLERIIEDQGIAEAIRTYNESGFTSDHLGGWRRENPSGIKPIVLPVVLHIANAVLAAGIL